ncbi:MAG TPA: pyridoxamine 5'-phosphate oxidase family protein [Bacteroidia bacterium]
MEFNKVTRGANRAVYDEQTVYDILDAGFMCHVAFVHQNMPMMIPIAFGRKEDVIYLHGSSKNFMLNAIIKAASTCICVTHLDGLVLARTLFDTSANYRSVVLHGKAELITDEEERRQGLKIITNHIIKGRWDEVPLGTDPQLKATMVVKMKIESASAKVRAGAPEGDEDKSNLTWSGHIPMAIQAKAPIEDIKFKEHTEHTESIKWFIDKYGNEN